jgi:predicted transcriptional regulator
MSSTVKDVMSTHVIAVRQRAGYKEMAAMLRDQRVSAFPVPRRPGGRHGGPR